MWVLFQACTCGRLSWSNFQERLVSLSQFILQFKSKLNIIQFKKAYQIFLLATLFANNSYHWHQASESCGMSPVQLQPLPVYLYRQCCSPRNVQVHSFFLSTSSRHMPRFMGTGKVRQTKTGHLNNKFKSNKELRVRFDIDKTTTILYSLNYFKKPQIELFPSWYCLTPNNIKQIITIIMKIIFRQKDSSTN